MLIKKKFKQTDVCQLLNGDFYLCGKKKFFFFFLLNDIAESYFFIFVYLINGYGFDTIFYETFFSLSRHLIFC